MRHLDERGDQLALVGWSSETGDVRELTYRQLHREVNVFASVLQSLGVAAYDAGANVPIRTALRGKDCPLFRIKASLEMPPTVWRVLILEDLAKWPVKLNEVIGAGEPLNPEVIERVHAAWGLTLRDGYGQTESTCMVGNPPGLAVRVFDGHLCITQRFLYGARPYADVIEFASALASEANRANIIVTTDRLREVLATVPAFQEDGKFSYDKYKAYVASQGLTEPIFEQRVRAENGVGDGAMAVGHVRHFAHAVHLVLVQRAQLHHLRRQLGRGDRLGPDAAL